MTTPNPSFQDYLDLASRALAGSVMWASDESFAERENLIKPGPSIFDPAAFGHKGKIYDGWETRRRRGEDIDGFDSAIVRLGVPGQIRGITVDTSWFTGNYPPEIAVWGLTCDELLDGSEISALSDDHWFPLVPRTAVGGDAQHHFEVAEVSEAGKRRVTHVRLDIIPDGGVARLRVHGIALPDPRFLTGTIDLASVKHGGRIASCSNTFYSSPTNIIGLGRASHMGEGWENARRRVSGNESVTIALAGEGTIRHVEVDTSYFVFNAPGEIALTGITANGDEHTIVSRTRVLPDTRHRFETAPEAHDIAFTAVRADVFPDGGLARLRINGELTDAALEKMSSAYEH